MYIDICTPSLSSPSVVAPEPHYPLQRTYNIPMLLAAYFIGILGSYTSTQLLSQVPATRRLSRKLGWTALSAFSIGGTAGVGMHWVKVLAAVYPYSASYTLGWPAVTGVVMLVVTFGVLSWDVWAEEWEKRRGRGGVKFSLDMRKNGSDEGLPLLPVTPVEDEGEKAGVLGRERAGEGEGLRRRSTPGPPENREAREGEREKERAAHEPVLVNGLYTPGLTPPAQSCPAPPPVPQPNAVPRNTSIPAAPAPISPSPLPHAPHAHHHPQPHPHPAPSTLSLPPSTSTSTSTSRPTPSPTARPDTPASQTGSTSSNQASLFLPSTTPSPALLASSQRSARISRLPLGNTYIGSAAYHSLFSLTLPILAKGAVLAVAAWLMHITALTSLHFPELDSLGTSYGYVWRWDLLLASIIAEWVTTTGIVLWAPDAERDGGAGAAGAGRQAWFAVFAPTAASFVHFLCVFSGELYTTSPPPPLPPRPSTDIPSLILTLAVSSYVLSYATLAHQITQSRNRLAETIFTKRRLWKVIAEKEAMARANEQKSEFIAVASHEIRTPLHAILGFTDLLLQTSLTEEQSTCLEAIRMGCNSIQLITNNVLDFSKLEHNTRESVAHATPVNVRTLALRILRSTSAPQRMTEHQLHRLVNYNSNPSDGGSDTDSPSLHLPDEKHVELLLEVHEAVPEIVKLDEAYITRVVMNLISNALKFTEDGFVLVRITVEYPKLVLPGIPAKPVLAISVRDSGIGIPPEAKQAIFEPFRQVDGSLTRTHTGAGLGLAISKQLCERMGGTIDVHSKPGVGSEFTVRVPAFEGMQNIPDPLHMPRPQFSFLTVAVAVRSLKTFHLYKELLERRGFLLRPIDLSHPEKECQVSLAHVDRLLVDVESLAVAPWLLDWIIRLPQVPEASCPISVYVLIEDLSNDVGQQLIRMLKGSGQVALVHRPVLVHTLLASLLEGVTLSPPTAVNSPFRNIATPLAAPKTNGKPDSGYEYFPPVFEDGPLPSVRTPRRESATLNWEDTVGRILNPFEPVVQRARAPSNDKRVRFEGAPKGGRRSPIHLQPPPPDARAAHSHWSPVGGSTKPSESNGSSKTTDPPAQNQAVPDIQAIQPPLPPPPKRHILLVEDNIVNQKLGIRLLQKLSHRCDVAENGKVALDMLKANEEKYHLVLMDCQMPVMNGIECTRQIRFLEATGARRVRIPIIALTANVSSQSREECHQAGADFFLPKPLLLQDLKNTLDQFIPVVT